MVFEQTDFKGRAVCMKLRSDDCSYGPRPEPEDDRLHSLTLTEDGQVNYNVTEFGGKRRRRRFKVEPSTARRLLDLVAAYFSENPILCFATDVGMWELTLLNEDGDSFKYGGSLCRDLLQGDVRLSKELRESLGLPDFFAFDGNWGEDSDE